MSPAGRDRPRRRASALVGGALAALAVAGGCSTTSGGGDVSSVPAATSTAPVPSSAAGTTSVAPSESATAGSTAAAPTTPESGPAIDQTVPVTAGTTLPPVPVGSPAGSGGVGVTVTRVESVQAEAYAPGQVAGPAVRLTVVIRNGTSAPLSVDAVTVDLQRADGSSALPAPGPGVQMFRGVAPAGGAATGVYVFTIAPADRSDVTVLVTYDDAPTVAFRGAV